MRNFGSILKKIGYRLSGMNYRPISSLSCSRKALEHLPVSFILKLFSDINYVLVVFMDLKETKPS